MGGVATLFRLWGIPVRVHASWLVIFGLIAWSLAVGYFPRQLPDLPLVTHWANGLLAALLLFVSVFLHELSHSVVAIRCGIPVASITLHIFGGVSEMTREPDRPGVEWTVAVVGPLTSFAIAAVLAGVSALAALPPVAAAVVHYLVFVNVLLGAFNLLPGFPLDGGRLLRALLWKVQGDLRRATRTASAVGTGFAFFLIGLGVLQAAAGQFLGGLWLILIGLFLRQAAEGSYQQLLLRRALGPLRVREGMTREVIHVQPDLSLTRVVDEFVWSHHVSSFPVVERDRVLGILSVDQIKTIPHDRWPETRVRDVMRPMTESLRAAPDESLWQALQKLTQNGLGRLAVVEGERLVGYLSVKDLTHILAVAAPEESGPPRTPR
jgi:Zn-dependent protease/predicted transcriptional regulator